jgi:hypothetical protein
MPRAICLSATLCLAALVLISCSGGGSNPAGGGGTGPAVHVAGYFNNGSNDVATYWLTNAAGEDDLNAATDSRGLGVWVYDGDVYVAGYYVNPNSYNAAGYWVNGTLVPLYSGAIGSGFTAKATSIYVDATGVYVAGWYNEGTKKACYWKDGTKTDVGTVTSEALAITASGGHTYVAGFRHPGTFDIACYWVDDEAGVVDLYDTDNARANAIAHDGTHVYAAGYYIPGSIKACYWIDDSTGITDLDGVNATSVFVSGATVYTAGYYNNGTNLAACYWKNATRKTLFSSTTAGEAAAAYSIFVHSGDVYVAGYYPSGGASAACYWRNAGANRTVLHTGAISQAQGVFVTD